MNVELLPLVEAITDFIIPVLSGVVIYMLNKYLGIVVEKKHAEALNSALDRGSDLILAQMKEGEKLSINLDSPHVGALVRYAVEGATDAVKHFEKANPKMDVARMATARLTIKQVQAKGISHETIPRPTPKPTDRPDAVTFGLTAGVYEHDQRYQDGNSRSRL